MGRPKKAIIPIKPKEPEDLKTYKQVKEQLSVYERLKQFLTNLI